VIEEGWAQIPRWQVDKKLVRTLSNDGSIGQPLKRELFRTTSSPNLVNTRTLSTQELAIVATMNMNPLMVVVPTNVLHIQLSKYHDDDDLVIHIRQLTKVCVINGKDTNNHKLQFFPIFLKRITIDWFAKYEMAHLVATWGEVQQDFINRFSEIRSEGQMAATLKCAKQKKYESIKDYYDRFL